MEQHNPASSGSQLAVVISPNSEVVRELEPVLNERFRDSPPTLIPKYPSPRDIGAALGTGASGLVFVDVGSDPDRGFPVLVESSRLAGIQVLAVLPGDDPDLILRCIRAGAADFLIAPFTKDQLDGALGKLQRMQSVGGGSHDEAKGTVVAVMPSKGACGATTVALNLAFFWRKLAGKKVLLADLDYLTGTVSFLLKIKSVHSFVDVLTRADELDGDLWRAMVTDVGGVDVLLAPESITEAPVDLMDPAAIIHYAKRNYDVTILDAGSVYGEWNLNQAKAADELLLVTTNELPALQASQRALSYLDTNNIERWKIRLIVNRYHKDVGLSQEVIGTALHAEVFESLPSDYDAVQKGLMEGKSVTPASSFGKSMRKLAERLGGAPEVKKKASGGALSGLLGLFSRPSK